MNSSTPSLTCTRRQAVQAILATGAAGFVSSRTNARPAEKDVFPLAVQTYTFRNFTLEQTLAKLQKLGVKNAEFYSKHVPPDASEEKLKAIRKVCADFGVTPLAFGVQRFSKNADANKKAFEFGKALGISFFSADPDPDSFDSLDKLVEEFNIPVGIHPHGPSGKGKHRWYSAETILKAVKDHHPKIGSCLDTGHLIRMAQLGEGLDPVEQIKIMGKRNWGLHLKDHDNIKKKDVIFGDMAGKLNVEAVLKALKQQNFAGYISIEYEANPEEPTKDVEDCVAYFRKQQTKV